MGKRRDKGGGIARGLHEAQNDVPSRTCMEMGESYSIQTSTVDMKNGIPSQNSHQKLKLVCLNPQTRKQVHNVKKCFLFPLIQKDDDTIIYNEE